MKNILGVSIVVFILVLVAGCGSNNGTDSSDDDTGTIADLDSVRDTIIPMDTTWFKDVETENLYDFCSDSDINKLEYDVAGSVSLAQLLKDKLDSLSSFKNLALVLVNGTELVEADLQTIATINKNTGDGGAGLTKLTSLGLCNLKTLSTEAFRGLDDGWLEYLYMDSLEEVEAFAFAGAHLETTTSLKGISLNSVTTIGEAAFQWSSLESLMLPNVLNIEKDAFRDNYRMLEVYLPKVEYLADAVFDDNTHLFKASFPELTMVGRNVFDDNHLLVHIHMPKVTYLGKSFFGSCWALQSVYFPSVETVDDNAFDNCQNLRDVNLPNAVDVRNRAFSECVSIKDLYLPKVTNFMNNVFSICSGEGGPIPNTCCQLERIHLPLVESVGTETFDGCAGLENVIFGDSQPSLGDTPFSNTSSDLRVYHTGSDEEWSSFIIDGNSKAEVVNCDSVDDDVCEF